MLVLVLALSVTSGSTTSAISEGLLSVKGTLIVNPVGRPVILRGVNYVGYETDDRYPAKHTESDYQLFAKLGFNVVRLPISWSILEPRSGTFYESYLTNYLDSDMRWAKKYGLYIVLDMHQFNWGERFGGAGIPHWVVNHYPPTDAGMRQAVTDFWTRTTIQDHLIEVWKKIAHRYVNESTIAGYDILNEPWIYTSINPDLDGSDVNDFYVRVIKSIRTVDLNHIVFLEPANMYTSEFPLKDKIVWSPHFYTLSFATRYHQSDANLLEADIDAKYQKFAGETGSPMWIGEFGAFMNDASSQQWLRDAVRAFSKYQIGWAWWAFNSRGVTIPSPLYTTPENQITSEETKAFDMGIGNVEPYVAVAVAFVIAVLVAIVYEIVHYGRRRSIDESS